MQTCVIQQKCPPFRFIKNKFVFKISNSTKFQLSSIQLGLAQFDLVGFGSVRFSWVRFGSTQLGSVRLNSVGFSSAQLGSIQLDSVGFSSAHLSWIQFSSIITQFGEHPHKSHPQPFSDWPDFDPVILSAIHSMLEVDPPPRHPPLALAPFTIVRPGWACATPVHKFMQRSWA